MREWVYLLLGYIILRREDDVMTSLDTSKLTWPVRDASGRRVGRITQEYRPPTHMGVDIAVPGHYADAVATVVAVAAGRVVTASKSERGWQVLIDHGDWASGYLHLDDLDELIVSDMALQAQNPDIVTVNVAAGQRLGPMGADPLDPERVRHLHIQLAPGGHVTDPTRYLAKAV